MSGIVLSASDYKEKDILITILTAELGKIKAVLRGAKQPKAKFKFAGQPFCFAEWNLIKRGEFFVVTSVNLQDAFYDLTADYDKFLSASLMLEISNAVLRPEMISDQMLVLLLTSLKYLVYEGVLDQIVLSKFMLKTLDFSGYGLNFKSCGVCNMPIAGDIVLSSSSNEFCCFSCSNGYGKIVSKKCYNILKIIDNIPFERLSTIKEKPIDLKECVDVLKYDISNVFSVKLKELN